jgi:hypothetical protein
MAAEVETAASSSNIVLSDGPLRRTVLPRYVPQKNLTLSTLEPLVDGTLQFACVLTNVLTADMRRSLTQLVCGVAKQVARELVVEKGSAGYDALIQASSYAGVTCGPSLWYMSLSAMCCWGCSMALLLPLPLAALSVIKRKGRPCSSTTCLSLGSHCWQCDPAFGHVNAQQHCA